MRVAILAGGGDLPLEAAQAARLSAHDVICIALGKQPVDGFARENIPTERVGWGQVGTLFKVLKQHNVDRLVLVGSLDRRPGLSDIQLDWGAVQMLPKLAKILFGGGDAVVLDRIADLFAANGVELAGVHEIAPSLVAGRGRLAGPTGSDRENQDAIMAQRCAWTAGALDMGQGGIAVGGRIVAMEGAEGTDAMLRRVADLREDGKISAFGKVGVLAKCPRPEQDLRLDMPTIGPTTIELAARAALSGVVIQESAVLISKKGETFSRCDDLGVALMGAPRADFLPAGFKDAAWQIQLGSTALP